MEKVLRSGLIQKITVVLLATLLVLLYLYRLDLVPVHLNQDEMMFGLNAYSIAKFGTDFYGNAYPFYFWHLGSFWATPIIVYTTSLFLRFLPFSEQTIRISGVFVGLSSIFLLAFLSKKIFKDNLYSSLALIVAGTVPVLFINSRVLLDNIWPIPFVVIWLILLKLFTDKKRTILIFLSGLALGIGLHSYHAAKLMMPGYFLITLVYLFIIKRAKFLSLALFVVGFAIPIIIFLPWLKIHPDTLLNQVSYIGSIDKSVNATNGIWGVFNTKRIGEIAANYITYFSPKILFVEGDRSLIHSTGRIGAFSFGIVFLLLFGIIETVRRNDWFSKIILVGFLTYPVAPSIVNDPQRISRGLVVIPFVVLLSVYGIYFLRNQKEKIFRFLVVAILFLIIVDFGLFLGDYFGNYRIRSNGWFNNNTGEMFESVIRSASSRQVSYIYVDKNIYFAENYFDFYQIKFGKNFRDKTIYFDPNAVDFGILPKNSLIAVQANDILGNLDIVNGFENVEIIKELNGYETFLVYYKD